jgi:large subunit ribosomal protein L28
MATFCYNCKKVADNGNNVSHAKNRTARLRKPNLHVTHLMIKGIRTKVNLCTTCLRTAKRAAVTA